MASYPFENGHQYRFIVNGQERSAATTTGKNVQVIARNDVSTNQIWVAVINAATELRFKNLATQRYLEKDAGDKKLKAESSQHGDSQILRSSAFKSGWKLNLFAEHAWSPIEFKGDGSIEWLELVKAATTIFEIYHIET